MNPTEGTNPKIDHEYTDEVVCPHCGHIHSHSHEFFEETVGATVRFECEACDKEFDAEQNFAVTYTTRIPKATP